jgi:hypothetical protein
MAAGSDANAAAGVGAPPNIQIRVIECKEAWFLDGGLREYRGYRRHRKKCCHGKSLE